MTDLPHLHVSCAVIERNGRILACQRSPVMNMPLKWEFPGGKIEAGESAEQCLAREVLEELALKVTILSPFSPVTHRYETFVITLYPFLCDSGEGEPVLAEHAAYLWALPEELPSLEWCEADLPILAEIVARLSPSR